MSERVERKFLFAEFELDTSKRRLLKNGQPLALNPKAFDLLAVLVNKHGQVLSKDELLKTVWEDSFVEENNLTVHISALRKIFGEKKNEHRFIVTIPGTGYKFVAEIQIGDENSSVEIKDSLPNRSLKTAGTETIIGRATEISELTNLLRNKDKRLITLTGAGGAGKTSLSQVVGNELKADFADGVFFVELAAVRDAEIVAPMIMKTLGANESGVQNYVEILKKFLQTRQILLILDNFEQIVAAAPLVGELLEATAELRILITSRVALHLENETEFAVSPLSAPPTDSNLSLEKLSDYASVELFVKRARSVKPNFNLNSENAKAIAGICTKLDGLPLAIELAAARVKLLSPESILARLENSLNLLTGNSPNYFQRTMRETVQWSYDLLDEDEQTLFRRLAVFAGRFTIKAAEVVCEKVEPPAAADVLSAGNQSSNELADNNQSPAASSGFDKPILDLIESLIDNNLLVVKEQTNGDSRLRMLEVVNEFALECLQSKGEYELLRKSHTEYFLTFAEELNPYLNLAESAVRCDRLEAEHGNLRVALSFLTENAVDKAARMAAAMWLFWYYHNHFTEGRRIITVILERIDIDTNISAVVRFRLFRAAAGLAQMQGDYETSQRMYEECIVIARTDNHLSHLALALGGLGITLYAKSDFAAAQGLIEEGLAIHRKLDNKNGIASGLNFLGNLFRAKGETEAARPLFEEALQLSRKIGNKDAISSDLNCLGLIAVENEDPDAARVYLMEAMQMAEELGNKIRIAHCLDGFAALVGVNGNYEQSTKIAGAVGNLREEIGYVYEPVEEVFREKYLRATRAVFDEKSFITAYESGGKFDLTEAVAMAKSLISVPDKEETEITIETHKLERIFIEEEIVESQPAPKSVKEIISSNKNQGVLTWLKNKYAVLTTAFLVLATVGGGYFLLKGDSSNGATFLNSSVKQLTTNGKVELAAISPDGKSFAYTTNNFGQKVLWLGYIDGGNHLQLRPEAEAAYYDLAFSPDGSRLYFSYSDDKTPKPALYKMPAPGGVAEKVLDEITKFRLSPDGGKIAYKQNDDENRKETLVIADLNTAEKHEVTSLPKSNYLSSINAETVSWSPDGGRLVFAGAENDSFKSDICTVEISSGKIERFKSDVWRDISKTVWLADGSGLIITAVGTSSWSSVVRSRIMYVELPSGKTRDITTDRSSYGESLSLPAKSDLLLSIEHRQLNNVWIAPTEDLSAAQQITNGSFGKYEGLWGMDFTPDGEIIYTNSDTESQFISKMNADGTEKKQLTTSGSIDSVLSVSNDGRYIVFHSNRSGGFDIWRMNANGSNPVQLTFGQQNYQPVVSADNLWVYYKSWENSAGALRRISINGGEPEILNDKETSWLSFSPDGKYFAAMYKTDKSRLAIFSADNNQVIKQFDIPKGGTLSMGSRWTPDGLAVIYRDYNFGYWQQAIEGGEAKRLEGLPKEKFYNFAFSKDGKKFAFVRGQEIRDVVLIQNVK